MRPLAHSRIDILVRSYYRDIELLRRNLASLHAYARGQDRILVVVPRSTASRIELGWVEEVEGTRLATCADFEDDYVGQQITKLHADRYTDAAVVLLMDADQRLTAPCALRERLFDVDGRLRLHPGRQGVRGRRDGWRRCAEDFFQQPFERDLAAPLPVAAPRAAFAGLRRECLRRHGLSLAAYCSALRGDRLCETALLLGWMSLYAGDAVHWEEGGTALLPECETTWSRAAVPARGVA